jgi:hypothetical protein
MTLIRAGSALVLVLLAACSRGVAIESEPGPVYTLSIENPMSHVMDVWYDDGEATRELGRINARQTREFIIAAPAHASIEIVARDEGRTHAITRRVELVRGGTPQVVLSP